MKRKVALAILIVVAVIGLVFVARSNGSEPTDNTPQVAATIAPIYDIVLDIAGEEVQVNLILPPGTSPHVFDPSPSTLRDIQKSSHLFAIGHGLDDWAHGIAGDTHIVTVDANISLRETGTHEDHDEHKEDADHDDEDEHEEDVHDEHAHGSIDPHYWLDPNNGIIIAHTAAEALAELSPEHADVFRKRAEIFEADMNARIATWQEQLRPVAGRPFMTLHEAFYYFAMFANVELVATFEPFPGKAPTPQYLAELSEVIEHEGVTTLFSEPQLATQAIASFASDNNIEIGILDPLGGVEGRVGYTEVLDYNIQTIIETLQ